MAQWSVLARAGPYEPGAGTALLRRVLPMAATNRVAIPPSTQSEPGMSVNHPPPQGPNDNRPSSKPTPTSAVPRTDLGIRLAALIFQENNRLLIRSVFLQKDWLIN